MENRTTTSIRVKKSTKVELDEMAKIHGMTVVELTEDIVHRSRRYRARGSG